MTIEEQLKNLEAHIDRRFDTVNARFDAMSERFNDVLKLLMGLQSDLRVFYRELGYQDARLDAHDTRLDNLEGK